MTERITPTPRELKEGEVFKPFEEIRLPHPFDRTSPPEFKFHFKGIEGTIRLHEEISLDEISGDKRTPLGKVQEVTSIEEGTFIHEKAPVEPKLNFKINRIDQFDLLQEWRLEMRIGERRFFWVPCMVEGDFDRTEIKRTVDEMDGQQVTVYSEIYEGEKNVDWVLLPYSNSLRDIEARFVPR